MIVYFFKSAQNLYTQSKLRIISQNAFIFRIFLHQVEENCFRSCNIYQKLILLLRKVPVGGMVHCLTIMES